MLGGGLVNKAAGYVAAAAHPLTGAGTEGASVGERAAKNTALEEEIQRDYEKAHPVGSGAAGLIGGALSLAPIAATGPGAWALGVGGKLIPAMARGAASGAALGVGDAAIRGEDNLTGAGVEGALGGAGGVGLGRALGKGIEAIASRRAAAGAPQIPTGGTEDVAGQPVRMSAFNRSQDVTENAKFQADLHGVNGPEAQKIAQQWVEGQKGDISDANRAIYAQLDQAGGRARTTPNEAANVITDTAQAQAAAEQRALAAQEQAHQAAVAQHQTNIDRSLSAVRNSLGVQGGGAQDAARYLQNSIQEGAERQRGIRNAAYDRLRDTPGEFDPLAFRQIGRSINERLDAADVRVNPKSSPFASEALDYVTERLSAGRMPANRVTPTPLTRINAAGGIEEVPQTRQITLADVDGSRKGLQNILTRAIGKARGDGNWGDVHDVRAVMDAFDEHVHQALETPGIFSGDAGAAADAMRTARAEHSTYRRLYTAQGAGDTVGRKIEDIIGRYPGQEAPISHVASSLWGAETNAGAGKLPVALSRRIFDLFPEGSPERAAWRHGLVEHAIGAPEGNTPLQPERTADRIGKLLQRGGQQASENLLPQQRAALERYAEQLRIPVPEPAPPPALNTVDRIMARIAGSDGMAPASSNEVLSHSMGPREAPGSGRINAEVTRRLQQNMTPEQWGQYRQAAFSRLIEPPEGKTEWEAQKLVNRISEYLNGSGADHANIVLPKGSQERAAVENLAKTLKATLPPSNATNPSKSGYTTTRILRSAARFILPILGAEIHGQVGLATGMAISPLASKISNARAAARTTRALYAPRATVSTPLSRGAPLAGGMLGTVLGTHRSNQ
jgi:hypothetical protein